MVFPFRMRSCLVLSYKSLKEFHTKSFEDVTLVYSTMKSRLLGYVVLHKTSISPVSNKDSRPYTQSPHSHLSFSLFSTEDFKNRVLFKTPLITVIDSTLSNNLLVPKINNQVNTVNEKTVVYILVLKPKSII